MGSECSEALDKMKKSIRRMGSEDSKAPYKKKHLYICWGVISLVSTILVVLVFFILWLSLQPKKLRYSLIDASISGYSPTNSDGSHKANFSVALRAENSNRGVSFYFDKINARVQFKKSKNATELLSSVDIPPFYHRRRNVTDLAAKFMNVTIDPTMIASNNMTKSDKHVGLEVELDAKIRIRIGAFKVHRDAKVICKVPPTAAVASASASKFQAVPCPVSIDF